MKIGKKTPIMFDGTGRSKDIKFNLGDKANPEGSCSVLWRGKMFLFGGRWRERSISVVDQCKLEIVGKLEFKMRYGSCAQRNNTDVFICFENDQDVNTYTNCRHSAGPLEQFSSLPRSTYIHWGSQIATNSGKPYCTR